MRRRFAFASGRSLREGRGSSRDDVGQRSFRSLDVLGRGVTLLLLVWMAGVLPNRASAQVGDERLDYWKEKIREIDNPQRRSAVYSFHENFDYSIERDPAWFASRPAFDTLFSEAYWDSSFADLTNENGTLAWKKSRDAVALLTMYETTGDLSYLERAWEFSNRALAARDDRAGRKDFSGKKLPVWSSSRYGSGRRTNYLVHSGLILQPILETLAYLDGVLTAADGSGPPKVEWAAKSKRKSLLDACLETLRYYDSDYREGPLSGEGHYVYSLEEEGKERHAQPFNRMMVVAWDLHLAGILSGQSELVDRGENVSRFFKNRVRQEESGAAVWAYQPNWPDPRPVEASNRPCDDISHGFFTVEPVVKLSRAGVVFGPEDMTGFARTVTRGFYDREYEAFFSKICGTPVFSRIFTGSLPGWLCLSGVDPEIYVLLERFLRENVQDPQALHLAYLVRNGARP